MPGWVSGAVAELSVLVPTYNEARTLERVLDEIEARPEVSELVVVDDGSTDATPDILRNRTFTVSARLIRHEQNLGKGAALRSAIAAASGDVALVYDADLEYDAAEFPLLLAPIERGRAEVVYGSRSFAAHSAYSFWFVIGNKVVTLWANILFNSYLSDVETCFKVMPLALWRSLDLRADGFDVEPEITAKLLKSGHRIYEVPISYNARTRADGKKLTWRDGAVALWTLSRIRLAPNGNGRGKPDGSSRR